jgi:hypothetical protein
MLDYTLETPVSLATLARQVPPARNGKRCHLSTILRWITNGAKAPDGTIVRLEGRRLGGRWLTSREALTRFMERLTPKLDDANDEPSATARTPAARRRASKRAARHLEEVGIA